MAVLWEDPRNSISVLRLMGPTETRTLIQVFTGIAQAECWQPGDALDFHQDRSIYFALEVEGQLAGGLQLVLPDRAGSLPCQEVWSAVPVSARSAHVMILALQEAYRGRSILFWLIAIEMWRFCVAEGIAQLFIEVTPRVLPLYRRLGWELKIVGEKRIHWGEECYLCTLGVPEVASALIHRAERSQYYRQIVAQAFRMTLPVLIHTNSKMAPVTADEAGLDIR